MKILVVDDEQLLVKGIKFNLENEGYQVLTAYDGATAVELARRESLDLIILDLMMPQLSGSEACMKIREFSDVPIIMLTARSEDADKLMGFACGADDYVTKPFHPLELVARVKTQLRRYTQYNRAQPPESKREFDFSGLRVFRDSRKCLLYDEELSLTPREFDILWYLCENRGRVISSEELFEAVWGEQYLDSNNTVMAHIARLREKLHEPSRKPKFIKTVWGVGYTIE